MATIAAKCKGSSHDVTAADVTAGSVTFNMGDYVNSNGLIVQVTTSAGVPKAWDGAATMTDGVVTVDNSGVTDWADTDIINVVAF